jgi:hypothetical protein
MKVNAYNGLRKRRLRRAVPARTVSPMNDAHFFADVNLPFHVWVREPSANGAFGWVLKEAPQARSRAPHGERPDARPSPTHD